MIVTTTSHSAASCALSPASAPCAAQNARSDSSVRQYATTRSIAGTAARMHATCVSACQPQPMTPSVDAPAFARYFAATRARRAGAELPEPVGLDDGDELGPVGAEEKHDEARPVAVAA